LLAFDDKQFIIYLGPALSHIATIEVGLALKNVPFFYETEPNLWPGPMVYSRFFSSALM
jgi:hypothetical protein